MARPWAAAAAALLLLALGLLCAGCAGGQSGSEGLCDDNAPAERQGHDADVTFTSDTFADEDGGVEDDGGAKEFTTGDNPEIQNGPASCPPPPEGEEY